MEKHIEENIKHLYDFPVESAKVLADSLFLYETGIEIECSLLKNKTFNQIINNLNLVESKFDDSEMRFRLKTGYKGITTLYQLCVNLKKFAGLNNQSGIHLHIDFREFYDTINIESVNKEWILNQLDSWKYSGNYNSRNVSTNKANWVRFCSYYKTIEFRICEMTFDYNVLLKRIAHCQWIVNQVSKNNNNLDVVEEVKINDVFQLVNSRKIRL